MSGIFISLMFYTSPTIRKLVVFYGKGQIFGSGFSLNCQPFRYICIKVFSLLGNF